MQSVMTVVIVSVAIIVAVTILAQLYNIMGSNFACPAQGTNENSIQQALRQGCDIFSKFGGILIIILPILAAATILFAYVRNWSS